MLSNEEVVCRVMKYYGNAISNIEYKDDVILLHERLGYDLFCSDIEELFNREDYNKIEYEGCKNDIIAIDLSSTPSIDNAFRLLKKAYLIAEPLVCIKKESDKIIIVIERGKGWGFPVVERTINLSNYDVVEDYDDDDNYVMTITVKKPFNILEASNSEIEDQLDNFNCIYAIHECNGTIAICLSNKIEVDKVRDKLNLPLTTKITTYNIDSKYLYIINELELRLYDD